MLIAINSLVTKIIFTNNDNGYAVLLVKDPIFTSVEDNQAINNFNFSELIVVGYCPYVAIGQNISAEGEFVFHPKFGKQFKCNYIYIKSPEEAIDIEKYLTKINIKGIGPKTAKKVVEKFGDKTLEILKTSPELLDELDFLNGDKALNLKEFFAKTSPNEKLIKFLLLHNLSPNFAAPICESLGPNAVELIKNNPYVLVKKIRGISFKRADDLALYELNLPVDNPERIKAAFSYILEQATRSGHSCLPKKELLKRIIELVAEDINITDINNFYLEAVSHQELSEYNGFTYLPKLYFAEEFIANFVKERTTSKVAREIHETTVDRCINEFNAEQALSENGFKLATEQLEAVRGAIKNKLTLISGGPGSGKTTITKLLVNIFQQSEKRLILAAPTGKAAHRLSQVCSSSASTIHRLLRFFNGRFFHGINNPLEADVVIIDEASMIDLSLAKALFAAIPNEAQVIIIGDSDQLPPVGPGRVFADLLKYPQIPLFLLNKIFRRKQDSDINIIASEVNRGEIPAIPDLSDYRLRNLLSNEQSSSESFFIKEEDLNEIVLKLKWLITEVLLKDLNLSLDQLLILTPTNLGSAGTVALNYILQDLLNPKKENSLTLTFNQTEFRIGDRVCQRENNYNIDDSGVFNGDTGIVRDILPEENSLVVELWDKRLIFYKPEHLKQLSLAYASTVHRAQGSESECVIQILHHSHFILLDRQLTYTGITRAKRLLFIIGSEKGLNLACTKNSGQRRYSCLIDMLTEDKFNIGDNLHGDSFF
jgi:exodeoxyribonuclease V alpha subunit